MKFNKDTYTAFHFSKMILKARKRLFQRLTETVNLNSLETILDIGATADQKNDDSNFFLKNFLCCKKITALSNEDAHWLEQEYPNIKFVLGDGRCMPFSDNSFDFVFSNAVIEHVGNLSQQEKFIQESIRVSKKHIFFTTPNRWYPIEFHTLLPLIHFLPKHIHRNILKSIGYDFFASEENLNLLDKATIKTILAKNNIAQYKIGTIRFFGLPSNIYIYIDKDTITS